MITIEIVILCDLIDGLSMLQITEFLNVQKQG